MYLLAHCETETETETVRTMTPPADTYTYDSDANCCRKAATSFEHRGPQCLLFLTRSTSPLSVPSAYVLVSPLYHLLNCL